MVVDEISIGRFDRAPFLLDDFHPIGIGHVPEVLANQLGLSGIHQRRTIVAHNENVAVLSETDLLDPLKDFPLNVTLHVVQVLPRSDEGVKRSEIFDIGNFVEVPSGLVRLGPLVFVVALPLASDKIDQVPNHIRTVGILHVEQNRALHFGTIRGKKLQAVQACCEVIASSVVEPDGPQRVQDDFLELRLARCSLMLFIKICRDAPCLERPRLDGFLETSFGLGPAVMDEVNGPVDFALENLASVFQVLTTYLSGFCHKPLIIAVEDKPSDAAYRNDRDHGKTGGEEPDHAYPR